MTRPGTSAFDELFDAIPDALVATDKDGVIVRMNETAGRLFACTPAEVVGSPMETLLPAASHEAYGAHRQAFVASGRCTGPELEGLVLTRDDRRILVDATVGRLDLAEESLILMSMREVSDRVMTQQRLERRLAVEELAVRISGRLNTSTPIEIDAAVEDALAELAGFWSADRSYAVQLSSDCTVLTMTHEWCTEGVPARIAEFQDVSAESLAWLMAEIARGRAVQAPSVGVLPTQARAEYARLGGTEVSSFVVVPMLAGGMAVGFLGMEWASEAVGWQPEEISTVMVLQDFFVNAIRRRRVAGELRRANRMLQAVSECNDALVRAQNEHALLRDICRIVVEAGGYEMSWVGVAVDDPSKSIRPIAKWGDDHGYIDSLHLNWSDTERGRGPGGLAARTRAPVVVQNIATDPAFPAFARDGALERGYASSIAVPFDFGDGPIGVLSVYAADVAAFETVEVEILQRFADDLAFGIAALRTRERRRVAERQLREMLRSKDRFIATIAHELRTPLTAVVGFAQVLRDGGAAIDPDERADMVRMVVEQGHDLTNIVDDLLVVAKAEAGTLNVASVRVNLRAQAAQVLEGCGLDPAERIEVVVGDLHAVGDPARVRQIIRNLVTNAQRYGGDDIRVVVERSGTMAGVSVWDDGPGVPPEEQEAIFEPYRRAHDAPGLTASLGLGLAISRQLASMMKGRLWYRRENDQTVFTLLLPTA